ncbi:MAG TPA: HAD hydrolase family protein [Polyangia bacterium]
MDLDGTLLRDDGSIAGDDRAAIAEARARGIAVTIATGRLPASTLPHARALDLAGSLVCMDGAVVVDAGRGAVTRTNPLSESACERVARLGTKTGLSTFFLTADALLARPNEVSNQHLASLYGFTQNVEAYAGSVGNVAATALRNGRPILAGFLVGPSDDVQHAANLVRTEERGRAAPEVEPEAFPVGDQDLWAVRVRSASSTKAAGLAAICAETGITAAEVAAVGDWYNDLSMLAWAGQSFVMGGAPAQVAQVARTKLAARAGQGGGIAEVVALLLRGHSKP